MAKELFGFKAAFEQSKSELEASVQQHMWDIEKIKHLESKLELAETETSSFKT